jgi:hypothetical protein
VASTPRTRSRTWHRTTPTEIASAARHLLHDDTTQRTCADTAARIADHEGLGDAVELVTAPVD